MAERSRRRGRIELVDELGELLGHGGIVVVGMLADEVDHLAIAVGGLSAVTARLVHHSEAVPAVVHVGEASEQVACSRLGLDKLGSANQVHYGVGGDIKRVLVSIFLLGPGEAGGDCCVNSVTCKRFAAARWSRRSVSRGAWALTSCSRATASSLARQHFLYLLPLPHGQGSLRPGLAIVVSTYEPRRTHPLYRDVLTDATFHQLLLACDRDLADTARGAGCKRCNGVVHSAHYWRKPRGRPCRLGREHDRRFSFCCAVDGCRSRATPPSLRFLGPKVYIAAIVVLIAILRHGATTLRVRELTEVIGVDRRTVERWRTWWRDSFTTTPFWKVARAAFMPPVDPGRLPTALIERFAGDDADRLVALLRFMGPITGGRMHAR